MQASGHASRTIIGRNVLPPVTGTLPSSAIDTCSDRRCSACVMGTTTRRTLPIVSQLPHPVRILMLRKPASSSLSTAGKAWNGLTRPIGNKAAGIPRDEPADGFVRLLEVVRRDRAIAEDPGLVDARGIHRAQQRLRFRLLRIFRMPAADARVDPAHHEVATVSRSSRRAMFPPRIAALSRSDSGDSSMTRFIDPGFAYGESLP